MGARPLPPPHVVPYRAILKDPRYRFDVREPENSLLDQVGFLAELYQRFGQVMYSRTLDFDLDNPHAVEFYNFLLCLGSELGIEDMKALGSYPPITTSTVNRDTRMEYLLSLTNINQIHKAFLVHIEPRKNIMVHIVKDLNLAT